MLLFTASFSCAGDDKHSSGDKQVEVSGIQAEKSLNDPGDNAWEEEDWEEEWEDSATIADPLEPLNRFFFHFNDKLYYWALKPVARVYSGFFPEDLQIAIRNAFDNLRTPARAVSCLLQGRIRKSSEEVVRFALNSTVGIFGVGDFAKDVLGLYSSYEDLGQTFATPPTRIWGKPLPFTELEEDFISTGRFWARPISGIHWECLEMLISIPLFFLMLNGVL
jgi:hypothetical protein